jgi:hypothetical protein
MSLRSLRNRVSKLRDRLQHQSVDADVGGFSVVERIEQYTAYFGGTGLQPPDLPCPAGIDPAQRARDRQQQLDALEPAFRSAATREWDGQPLPPDEQEKVADVRIDLPIE